MTYSRWVAFYSAIVVFVMTSVSGASKTPRSPRISAFMASPVRITQDEPVMLTFALSNSSDKTIYSQLPYSGSSYSINESMSSLRFSVLQDRYTVAVSIDGGNDGYPYRWGFRGYLSPGRTTTIQGHLSITQTGRYVLNAVLMKGDAVVDPDTAKTAVIRVGVRGPQFTQEPIPPEPMNPYYNYQDYEEPQDAYESDGGPVIANTPYVLNLSRYLRFVGNGFVINSDGYGVTVLPDSPLVFVHGQLVFPRASYPSNGYSYFSPPRLPFGGGYGFPIGGGY